MFLNRWWKKLFQARYQVFHLHPDWFPKITREFLPIELILAHGVLPLGVKSEGIFSERKILNVGFLNPKKQSLREVEKIAQQISAEKKFDRIRAYRILEPEFQQILQEVYHVSASAHPTSTH